MDWTSLRERLLGESNALELPPNFKLPTLPTAVTDFVKQAKDPDVPIGELAKILETDAGLTVDILQQVNSSAFALRSQAKSVKQALNLMGIAKVCNFIMTSGVKRAMSRGQSKLINLNHFWSANLERALFAREVAQLMNVDGELAYAAAMLQDFLLPPLSSAMFNDYSAFVDNQLKSPRLMTAFEQEKFQWDHAVAAAHVAHQWNFPDELICCLHQHHQGLQLMLDKDLARSPIAAVGISSLLPDAMHQSPHGIDQLIKLQATWRVFDLTMIAEKVEQNFHNLGGTQHHYFTFSKRLQKHFDSRKEMVAAN